MKNQIKTKIESLKTSLAAAEVDFAKFETGNSSAGTRLRQSMQNMKTEAQDIRNLVTKVKNGGV